MRYRGSIASALFALAILLLGGRGAAASDHGDAPSSMGVTRQDANITDLFAFLRPGGKLVLILCSNPAIPPSAATYRFPSDVTFEILIDTHSEVSPQDPGNLGGTILHPEGIAEDIVYRVQFTPTGQMRLWERRRVAGRHWIALPLPPVSVATPFMVRHWFGLRDDPFIRGPRIGRNVAAVVLEVPLRRLRLERNTLLIWATSRVAEFDGPFQDMAGRSLRSMMPENSAMNSMPPNRQLAVMGKAPDVMIYDLSRPARFPNGRALEDDVVDLVGDPRVLANDAPFPSANDVPFLPEFPYLAPPHPPVGP